MQFAKSLFPLPSGFRTIARGLAGYATAEMVNRIVRLGAALVIARHTDAALLGTAALALSLFELTRVLTQAGIGQRIVAATDDELEAICARARQLFWACCLGVAGLQLSVAAGLWWGAGLGETAAMLGVLSLVYLTMPPGLVQIFLLMRQERLGLCATIATSQAVLDHLLTALLIVFWPSAWAIVLPKLLTAPAWTLMARRFHPWKRAAVAPAPVSEFRSYCGGILASEAMAALRLHADKLIVSATLGVQGLGTYYFAFGAGLGIIQSLVAAFGTVMFASLCRSAASERASILQRSLMLGLVVLVPIVALQALLAPLYVPVVFGDHWAFAAPYLALLCAGAIPLFIASGLGAALRAEGRSMRDAALSSTLTMAALAGLALGASHSLAFACAGYSLGMILALVPQIVRRSTARLNEPLSSHNSKRVIAP